MATFLEGSVPVSLEDVLVFFTGSDKKNPVTGYSKAPRLLFSSDTGLATSSICDFSPSLPVVHSNYNGFKDSLVLSLKGHIGFGLI